jgi:hypothetical protein
VVESSGDAPERMRALGAEIAEQDEHRRPPQQPNRQSPPRWLVWFRWLGLAVFTGQMIYAGGFAHDGLVFIGGLVGFVIWLGLLARS